MYVSLVVPQGSVWGRETYGPELLAIVEVHIVLGDLLEDTEVILCLIEGANRRVAVQRE